MHTTHRTSTTARKLFAVLGLALAVSAADSLALAQTLPIHRVPTRSPLNRTNGGPQKQPASAPAPRPSNPTPPASKPTPHKIGLGGVKSKAPRPIGSIKGTLLPPPPPATKPPNKPPHNPPHDHDRGDRGDHGRDDRGRRGGDRDHRGQPGFSVDGSLSDADRFRLGFHLGSSYYPRYYGNSYGYGYGYSPYYGYPYYNNWYYEYPPSQVIGYQYPVPGTTTQPTPENAPEPRELTLIEQADLAFLEGSSSDAVELYRDYLRNSPEDGQATRSLALALILDKNVKEGVAVMQMIYEKQPDLATKPVRAADFPEGKEGLRDMLLNVVSFANRTKSASGYLTEVVIMQAEGRNDHALRMLGKARNAGLNEETAKELENALKP